MRLRAAALIVGVAAGGLSVGGCTVGGGSGAADGTLFEIGCTHAPLTADGGVNAPVPYSLKPVFFAGSPIEDLSTSSMHMNQLEIRMQNNGLAIQYADDLFFDILNSYEVARCVRGQTKNGQPQWNVTETLPDGSAVLWCDWSDTVGGSDGGVAADAGAPLDGGMSVMASAPRIHLTPYTDVRASFVTYSTCGVTDITAVAADGWIQFQNFGSAEQGGPTEDRGAIPTDFVIQYSDRLRATFHVVLTDSAIIAAKQENRPPPQEARMGGTLDGYFDFNLERGRAAQPFP